MPSSDLSGHWAWKGHTDFRQANMHDAPGLMPNAVHKESMAHARHFRSKGGKAGGQEAAVILSYRRSLRFHVSGRKSRNHMLNIYTLILNQE